MKEKLGSYQKNVKDKMPLIHCITNYVTVNDVANVLLATGASPIMADDAKEVEEITSICKGLVINIGTLNERTVESMLLAGKKAKELGHLCVLDPVGAGASKFRTDTAKKLKKEIAFDVIRGNMSEIKALAGEASLTSGVDVNEFDKVTKENKEEAITYLLELAKDWNCVVAVTGELDIITDETHGYVIENGAPYMSQVTGTGCQLSALIAAFISANDKSVCEATAAAVGLMGLAGEIALEKLAPSEGNATYRTKIIDAIATMSEETLDKGIRYETFKR